MGPYLHTLAPSHSNDRWLRRAGCRTGKEAWCNPPHRKHTGRPVRGISEWVFTFHGAVCRLGQLFTPNHCETTHKGVNNQRFDGKMYVVFRDEGGIPCIPARLTFTCGGFRPGAGCGASHRIRMAELVSFLAGVGGQGAVCMAAVRVRPADRCFGWGHHLLRIAPHD